MSKFIYENELPTIIEWYKQGKSYADIARLLSNDDVSKTAQRVRNLLRKHLGDIKGHPKSVITEELKQRIDKYLQDNKSPIEISKLLGINYSTLGWYLQKLGLKFSPNKGNIHYFDKIDTYAKAYILGFIAADGSLVPAKNRSTITLTITVRYEDKAVLEFIKSEIGNSHKLIDIVRPASYDPTKTIHHTRLSFSTPEIVHDIMKYGITPRKSLTMENILLNIPVGFRDAFIIGYFDGDGSVSIVEGLHPNSKGTLVNDYSLYIQIRGTKAFLEGICDHLGVDKNHIHQNDSIPSLAFANKKDTYRLYKCYEYLPFYYKRKHDKFLQRIYHSSYDKYKQVQTISSSIV